jgi:hypothetical protein
MLLRMPLKMPKMGQIGLQFVVTTGNVGSKHADDCEAPAPSIVTATINVTNDFMVIPFFCFPVLFLYDGLRWPPRTRMEENSLWYVKGFSRRYGAIHREFFPKATNLRTTGCILNSEDGRPSPRPRATEDPPLTGVFPGDMEARERLFLRAEAEQSGTGLSEREALPSFR